MRQEEAKTPERSRILPPPDPAPPALRGGTAGSTPSPSPVPTADQPAATVPVRRALLLANGQPTPPRDLWPRTGRRPLHLLGSQCGGAGAGSRGRCPTGAGGGSESGWRQTVELRDECQQQAVSGQRLAVWWSPALEEAQDGTPWRATLPCGRPQPCGSGVRPSRFGAAMLKEEESAEVSGAQLPNSNL